MALMAGTIVKNSSLDYVDVLLIDNFDIVPLFEASGYYYETFIDHH
jgi:hypothetical protein